MSVDKELEAEIAEKANIAPRVTLDMINAVISSEHYFTAEEGVIGNRLRSTKPETPIAPAALSLMTICILVLKNGFTVLGKSACASPENYNEEIGRMIAHQDAVNQIWPLEGYLLKQLLHQAYGTINNP